MGSVGGFRLSKCYAGRSGQSMPPTLCSGAFSKVGAAEETQCRLRESRLKEAQYPAPGDPEFALLVQKLLAPVPVRLDDQWGLDHGTWAVLCHVYSQADIPVVQLSIDETQPASFH